MKKHEFWLIKSRDWRFYEDLNLKKRSESEEVFKMNRRTRDVESRRQIEDLNRYRKGEK